VPLTVFGTFQTKLGVAKESTAGTLPANPLNWIPCLAPKVQDNIKWFADKALRGQPAESYGHYQLVGLGEVAIDGPFYPDTPGYFPFCLYGQDTVTAAPSATTTTGTNSAGATTLTITSGTGYTNNAAILIVGGGNTEGNIIVSGGGTATLTLAAPLRFTYTAGAAVTSNTLHQFKVIANPQTMSLWDFYAENTRAYSYGTVAEFAMKWAAAGEVSYAAKLNTTLSTTSSIPASSFTTVPPLVGWQAAIAFGGTTFLNLEDAIIAPKRVVLPIYATGNTQNPQAIFAGVFSATGKFTFQMSAETEYNRFRNATFPVLDFYAFGPAPGFQGSAAAAGVVFQASQPAYTMAIIDRTKDYLEVTLDFETDYSATDAGVSTMFLTNPLATYT
jgi:hypothetical protein